MIYLKQEYEKLLQLVEESEINSDSIAIYILYLSWILIDFDHYDSIFDN